MTTPTAPSASATLLITFALAIGGFAIGTAEFATMSLLPAFSREFGVSEPIGAHAVSAYALGVVVGAPLLAVLGAKMSRRHLLMALMGWYAAANASSALAPNLDAFMALRFLSGLPHGAYFGIAALVATSVTPAHQRTQAVGRIMLGLTVATIIGVPMANLISLTLGWRTGFWIVAGLAILTVICVGMIAPRDKPAEDASPLRELSALARGQVWLTLAIGAVGFGGLFAVYAYLASTLTAVTGVNAATAALAFSLFGVGMTIGNIVGPRIADKNGLMPTAAGVLVWTGAACALYPLAAPHVWSMALIVVAIGGGGALGAILQTRLMDVAHEGQALAAALNHSAFNAANALGPFLAGLTISAGMGWTSSGWVGVALSLGGLAIWAVAMAAERRSAR